MTRRVLVLGARAPVAVDLARAFAAAGFETHFGDSVTPWAARWSRAGRGRIHRLPPPRVALDAFGRTLADLVDRLDPVQVVPTCEEVFYVAAVAARHGFADRVFAPPPDLLRTLHSKVLFPAFARGHGVAAPETFRVTEPAEIPSLPFGLEAMVLKPEYSRFGTATLIRSDAAGLARAGISLDRPWAAQRFVEGEEVCLWTAARAGEVVASAAYRPRWRHGRAAAYAFERVDNPAILAIAERVAAATGMTGHLSFDLIIERDGTVVPIECNPRAVSGLHLFDGCPDLARAMLGEGPPATPEAALRYLAPAMAILGVPAALRQGRWAELRADWRRGADALGRPGDRLPALGALVDATRFALLGLTRRRSAAGATTDDIEWNGEDLA